MSNEYQPFEIDLDLDNVKEWSGERRPLLPIGTYKFEIVNVSNEGKYVAVEFKVLEGEHTNARAWNNYMTGTKPGQARLKQLMLAAGANTSRFNSDELMGMTIYADVVHTPGKAKVDEMGNPLEPVTFANIQNERAQLAEGETEGAEGDDAQAPDPEPPPETKSKPEPAPPAPAPAPNGQAKRARRA